MIITEPQSETEFHNKMERKIIYNALDTETIHGNARILSTPGGYWMAHSFEECVDPLIKDAIHKGSRYFCWNLDFDSRAILKYLPKDVLKELADNNIVSYNDYELFYIQSKVLSIKPKGKIKVTLYDIAQFYNFMTLDSAGKEFLGIEKLKNPVSQITQKNHQVWPVDTMEQFYKRRFHEIGEYCKQDATMTMHLAKIMGDKIKSLFGITLQSWSSKAGIAEKLSYKKGKYPLTFPDALFYQYAEFSFGGGMFDLWQKGFFKNGITECDLSSAYPYVLSKLPHWGNGEFIEILSESELLDTDYYGWVKAYFDCPYIPYDANQFEEWEEVIEGKKILLGTEVKKIYYADGVRGKIITLSEYKFMKEYGYPCELVDGYVWRQTNYKHINPFDWITQAYEHKAETKEKYGSDSVEYSLLKIAMNGCYGKTVQRVGAHMMQDFRTGSYITAETRVRIAKFIINHNLEEKVILIATDGIYLDGIYNFEDLETGLGSWDVEYYDDMLVLGNGVYECRKSGHPHKTRLRGYGNGKYKYEDTVMSLGLNELIQKHRGESTFYTLHKGLHKRKPNSLKMCLNSVVNYTEDDINVFGLRDKVFNCDSNNTKHWTGINNFGDLLDNKFVGKRYTIEELDKMEEHT